MMISLQRTLKWAAILLSVIVLLFAISFLYISSVFSVERGPDYKNRMVRIWPEEVNRQHGYHEAELDRSLLSTLLFHVAFNPLVSEGPYFTAYKVDDQPAAPAVLILPGGGYAMRSEYKEGIAVAKWLNSQGVAAFVLNYRLEYFPAPLEDVRQALTILRTRHQEFNIDPDRLGVMGFSAGGHLAAMSSQRLSADGRASQASKLAQPNFLVLAYPLISLAETEHPGVIRNLLGVDYDPLVLESLSVDRHIESPSIPTFIWTSEADRIIPFQQSLDYANELKKKGVEYELHLYPEGQHGSGLAQSERYAKQWPTELLAWMARIDMIHNFSEVD